MFFQPTHVLGPVSSVTRTVASEETVLLANSPTPSGNFCVLPKAQTNIWIPSVPKGVRDPLGELSPDPFWLNNYAGLPLHPMWCQGSLSATGLGQETFLPLA